MNLSLIFAHRLERTGRLTAKKMNTYTSVSTSKLQVGMTVHIHGSEFRIMSNPVKRSNVNGEYYTVGCMIIEQLPKGDYMEMLNDYTTIQSNDLATYAVVNN